MSDERLKPCPFCGGEAKMVEQRVAVHKRIDYAVRCRNIGCTIRPKTDWFSDKSEAIKHWNTRKPMERIVERLEEGADFYREKWNHYFSDDAYIGLEVYKKAIEIVKEVE